MASQFEPFVLFDFPLSSVVSTGLIIGYVSAPAL
jgi:hypothetical protein